MAPTRGSHRPDTLKARLSVPMIQEIRHKTSSAGTGTDFDSSTNSTTFPAHPPRRPKKGGGEMCVVKRDSFMITHSKGVLIFDRPRECDNEMVTRRHLL